MSHKFGFPAMTKRASEGSKLKSPPKNKKPFSVRVIDIIMDENHPLIKNGEYNLTSIGLVKCVGTSPINFGREFFALPLNPNNRIFPVLNEYLILTQSPVPNSNGIQYFYDKPLGLYGSSAPNSNPFPSTTQPNTPPSQNVTYPQVESGAVNIIDPNPTQLSTVIPSNPNQPTFVEKSDIHPLMPFIGDILYEGRWGQSLRFGNTSKSNSQYKNNWSTSGKNGDPITILRNGQPSNSTEEGWVPIVENINQDLSSIYLTSYQKIPFSITNENFISYTTPPISPSQYSNPQIILNSDRIVLNAKNDSILISGQNSVGLSSNGSVNIDSPSVYFSSNDIKLGSINATEPALLGNITVELLKQLTKAIKEIATVVSTLNIGKSGVVTTGYNAVAGNALLNLTAIALQLESTGKDSLKSKTTKIQ